MYRLFARSPADRHGLPGLMEPGCPQAAQGQSSITSSEGLCPRAVPTAEPSAARRCPLALPPPVQGDASPGFTAIAAPACAHSSCVPVPCCAGSAFPLRAKEKASLNLANALPTSLNQFLSRVIGGAFRWASNGLSVSRVIQAQPPLVCLRYL